MCLGSEWTGLTWSTDATITTLGEKKTMTKFSASDKIVQQGYTTIVNEGRSSSTFEGYIEFTYDEKLDPQTPSVLDTSKVFVLRKIEDDEQDTHDLSIIRIEDGRNLYGKYYSFSENSMKDFVVELQGALTGVA